MSLERRGKPPEGSRSVLFSAVMLAMPSSLEFSVADLTKVGDGHFAWVYWVEDGPPTFPSIVSLPVDVT